MLRRILALSSVVLLLLCLTEAATPGVYLKLVPGVPLCVNYEAVRDPDADPAMVSVHHRAIDSRLIYIRSELYSPGPAPGVRGPKIPIKTDLNSLGHMRQINFEARETGTYVLCLTTPLRQPMIRIEVRFSAANDLIDPPTADDDALVVDKPVTLDDYENRIRLLEIAAKDMTDGIRGFEMAHSLLDQRIQDTLYLAIGTTVLNMVVGVLLFFWAQKYLEKFFVKQKIA
ncbi:hypothetical protein STCU_00555 [Strigomonas culicis]|uniref:GOLD domain-containing protein n=1 Tax=Strigomonas culicis TaxID=28005 RepID=S9WKH1_9TRYP|nr:hypothetical protein STCU_00555 [Strigomonas culicis]|eukprot:EPY36490.1 hypothetical protein STCU_00555 [Strigomonas culicis]